VICTKCGATNPAGLKFCEQCGTKLAIACAGCGSSLSPTARFCGECGVPVVSTPGDGAATPTAGADAATPTRPGATPSYQAPIAERRLVTVLFADLVGFTTFAEGRDAEEVRETLSRYFGLASDVVGRYGGTVEKFIGDAVMAVWGTPIAREDDAERAVRAGLDLVDAVRTLHPTITARAGILTGEAAVTLGATNQGMVAGDLVNTASRLQSIAPPGSVLVGEATHRAASRAIVFEEVGEQLLKGKTSPVPAWRALRVVAQRGGQGRSDLPEPPFVGRDDELRLLKDALTTAGRDRRTRLVSITGAGGIGKSRLAWEVEKYIDGLMETVYWHRGRSPAYGDGITFWALGEMVRRRARLAETDDESTTRARISATLDEHIPDPDDRRWVEPALLTLLGLEPAPPGGRDVLFAAWRIFFERIAAKGTTVLLFEDLQWADSGLLDFIDHVLDWSKGVPIVVITLARPELFDRRPDWGTARRNVTAVALEPLSEAAMRELLAGFVPGLPRTAVDAILGRADGIPLYAVETVRALVADGRLEVSDGAYRPIGDLDRLTIPETLRSLIASRLDALDPTDRSLVLDASVLGHAFTVAGLAAVNGWQPADLEARLLALVRREMFELEADPRSPERGQYRFVQSLIREVAYSALARRERRTRHLAAARYFEMLGEDELAGALANHYLAAHEASTAGAEAEAVAIQARLALRGAAERAASLGAHDQAVTYLVQAVAVTPDAAERADLRIRAATSASDAADHDRAETLAREAVEEYRLAEDPAGAGRATAELGAILLNAGKVASALDELRAALDGLSGDTPEQVRARLLANVSRSLYRNDRSAEAVEMADRALEIAERLDLEVVVADAFNNKAAALSYLGRRREAVALMEAAIAIAERGGFVAAELRARSNLASVLWSTDPYRAGQMQFANLELARRVGNLQMAEWIALAAIAASWQAGEDWDAGLAIAEEALAAARSPVDEAAVLGIRSIILVARGESTDADAERLDAIASASGNTMTIAAAASLHGDRAFWRGEYHVAFDEMVRAADTEHALTAIYLDDAMRPALWGGDPPAARATADRLDADPGAGAALQTANRIAARAGIAALEGRREDALAGYRDARGRYRDLRLGFKLACVSLDMVVLLGLDDPEVRSAADEARTTFERLGARPYLDRLEAAVQSTVQTR